MQVMTPLETMAMILAVAAGTVITRFLPFWLFPESKGIPHVVAFLGQALPPAMMGLLVIYCLKGTDVLGPTHALPEIVALAVIYVLHRIKHNALLSIAGGTAVYVLLLRASGHQPKNIITMDSTTNTIAQILVISASLASMPLALFLPKKVSAAPLMAPRPLRSLLCKSTVTIITRADIKSRMPTIQ